MNESQPLSDPEAWVDEHGDALYSYALSRLKNTASAEDVVQETLLAALKSGKSFSGRSSARDLAHRHPQAQDCGSHPQGRP